MNVKEKINEQEKRMIDLIKENAQLKRDSLVLEALLAENAELRREIKERRGTPVSAKDWEMKIADTQSKYKGKAIAEGKAKKKIITLETKIKCLEEDLRVAKNDLEAERAKKTVEVEVQKKPKLCIVRADHKVFSDLTDAYERIDLLLLENEAYRDWCSKVERDNYDLRAENQALKEELSEKESHVPDTDIDTYEELLSETSKQLMEAQDENSELKKKIQVLEGKLQSKEIMYNSYKEKNGASILIEGVEEDLYPGEQRDIIISYIKDRMGSIKKNTRQYHVCMSILEANPENGTRATYRRRIFETLKTSKHIFSGTRIGLEDIGVSVDRSNSNHPRLVFKDDERYQMVISGTPSDSRAGSNAAMEFCKMVL